MQGLNVPTLAEVSLAVSSREGAWSIKLAFSLSDELLCKQSNVTLTFAWV